MRVLFVCTGNTCRSPMAEAVFRRLASNRLDCHEQKLLDHKIDVLSAGVAAADSAPAAAEAIRVLGDRGIDLSNHLSQQVTNEMLEKSELVLTMTASHLEVLRNARPDLADRMRVLRPDGGDISDPIGGGLTEYQDCADEITSCLDSLLDDLIKKDTPGK
ncbi:low molecular weight protein arginine phosphatase [Fuerstiella marisgermanici]|nr:low molecular weight protein arginine phosphatase [Fuerstiella marisgermanici]